VPSLFAANAVMPPTYGDSIAIAQPAARAGVTPAISSNMTSDDLGMNPSTVSRSRPR
jgi:hypothetical protein